MPPVWPRPRPDIIGTGTPHAAASGASTSDVLSPTPPVLCLSTLTPGIVAEIDADARVDHRVGQPGGLLRGHAAQENRHQQRRRLIVGQGAGGDAVDEEPDLVAAERPPVPLRDDDVDGAHPAGSISRLARWLADRARASTTSSRLSADMSIRGSAAASLQRPASAIINQCPRCRSSPRSSHRVCSAWRGRCSSRRATGRSIRLNIRPSAPRSSGCATRSASRRSAPPSASASRRARSSSTASPPTQTDGAIAEAAALLHDRDLLHITFLGEVSLRRRHQAAASAEPRRRRAPAPRRPGEDLGRATAIRRSSSSSSTTRRCSRAKKATSPSRPSATISGARS